MKLSVVLLTRNEEDNIQKCLESVKNIASEIVIFDEFSTDETRSIARKHGAKVYKVKHLDNFHINKQRAIEKARSDWVLQLDADERVTQELSSEIKKVINEKSLPAITQSKRKLFQKHQKLVEARDGKVGTNEGDVVAYFISRINLFLGEPLRYAGVYPDAVIRLFKNGKGRLPAKSVHELAEIDGRVGWLSNDLIHDESPTLQRYIARNNNYTSLMAKEYADRGTKKNLSVMLKYAVWKPKVEFLKLYIRHKGYKDGMRGFVWSFYSAWRFPLAYFKYWTDEYKN
ncbi:glycosyltransferase family 2 protein [Patescibacteria group bacterium]